MNGWSVEGIRVVRSGRALVDGVTAAFPPGRVTALVGPNGSGKSTLLRVAAGLWSPDEGTIAMGTTRGWREPDWARAVACVLGTVPADVAFSVEEVLLAAFYPDGGRWLDPSEEVRRPLVEALDRLEVFPEGGRAGLARAYGTLSAGERQLVDVIRGLVQKSPVVLLDEPTSALDLRHRLLVRRELRAQAALGRTIVLSLHDVAEAASEVDAVVVLQGGRVAAAGAPDEVLTDGLLAQVWGVVRRGGNFVLKESTGNRT